MGNMEWPIGIKARIARELGMTPQNLQRYFRRPVMPSAAKRLANNETVKLLLGLTPEDIVFPERSDNPYAHEFVSW